MRVKIVAVGRLRNGPHKELFDDYMARAQKLARPFGMTSFELVEIEDKKATSKEAQGALLLKAIQPQSALCALDERGEMLTSPEFARKLENMQGRSELAFAIGGANGLTAPVLARADITLSLGRMVWPHMLTRVMLAEQLYRASSILAGTPYHRA